VQANRAVLGLSADELLLRMGRQLTRPDETKTQVGQPEEPDDEALRATATEWLAAQTGRLRKILCPEWRKQRATVSDMTDMFMIVVPLLESAGVPWPIGVPELAAFLVKRGLDELCGTH
jgi:hypothetical protein